MAIDINSLPTVAEGLEPLDWDNYADPQEFAPPIREQNGQLFKMVKCEPVKYENGILSFIADHEAFDDMGNSIGKVTFDRFSTKVFDRSGVKASMAADQLRALGVRERPQSPKEWADLMLSGVGQTWKGDHHWEGYCNHKDTPFFCEMEGSGKARKNKLAVTNPESKDEFTLKGMKAFPLLSGVNGTAEYKPVVDCPVCGKEVRANTRIGRRLPAS